MNASPLTIGLMMVSLGLLPNLFAHQQGQPVTPLGAALSAALVVGGVALVALRRPMTFYVALAPGLFTIALGVAGLLTGRPLGLPLVPPALSLVLGVYVSVRVVLARPALLARKDDPSDEESPPEE